MPNIRSITAEQQKIANEELGEVPERLEADIEALRTWISQQGHLKARTDDQFLVGFLRGSKYSLEKAKAKIDKYYTLRSKYPEMFTCRDYDLQKMLEIVRTGLIFYLPKPLNETGQRIVMMRSGIYPAGKYTAEEVLRVTNALHEIIMLEDDHAIINGVVFIGDMKQLTMAHMVQFTPSIIKKMTVYSEEAMPFRPKGTHFLNTPAGFEQVFNIFKPMLSVKQQQRLHVHGSKHELLYEHVPQKYLPKEYGGENGTIDDIIAYWEQKLIQYDKRFKEEVNYGTDEMLRPGKPIDFNGLFGIDGSFRKLDVD